ncbi:MAG: hypothetical protein AAF609_15755 [Cyanobacteria bacterium P01_C01_bin.120]
MVVSCWNSPQTERPEALSLVGYKASVGQSNTMLSDKRLLGG